MKFRVPSGSQGYVLHCSHGVIKCNCRGNHSRVRRSHPSLDGTCGGSGRGKLSENGKETRMSHERSLKNIKTQFVQMRLASRSPRCFGSNQTPHMLFTESNHVRIFKSQPAFCGLIVTGKGTTLPMRKRSTP